MLRFVFILTVSFLLIGEFSGANAQKAGFTEGPIFESFGPASEVQADFVIPKNAKFKVLFDVATPAKAGSFNRNIESAARFINMHAKSGVPLKNMEVVIVVHGKASFDLTKDFRYAQEGGRSENQTRALITSLQEKGVRLILCGQSAAYHNISKSDLVPGIEVALSAMTAHALLQQDGYTLNPF